MLYDRGFIANANYDHHLQLEQRVVCRYSTTLTTAALSSRRDKYDYRLSVLSAELN